MKNEYKKVLKSNEDLKKQVEKLDRDFKEANRNTASSAAGLYPRETPIRCGTAMGNGVNDKTNSSKGFLDELSYNQHFES